MHEAENDDPSSNNDDDNHGLKKADFKTALQQVLLRKTDLTKIYEPQFIYHYCAWLQGSVCQDLFRHHGATDDDLNLWANTHYLEIIWSQLSRELRLKLVSYKYGISFNQENPELFLNQIDKAMARLSLYSALSTPKQQTYWMDKYFPNVKSSDQHPYNLHVARNLKSPATHMIQSMDWTNWKQWATLLQALEDCDNKSSQHIIIAGKEDEKKIDTSLECKEDQQQQDVMRADFHTFRYLINAFFQSSMQSQSKRVLFCVSSLEKDQLWNVYLDGFATQEERKFHDCHTCRYFIHHFGACVVIPPAKPGDEEGKDFYDTEEDDDGWKWMSPLWGICCDMIPKRYHASVIAMNRLLTQRDPTRLTSMMHIDSGISILGKPQTGHGNYWHLYGMLWNNEESMIQRKDVRKRLQLLNTPRRMLAQMQQFWDLLYSTHVVSLCYNNEVTVEFRVACALCHSSRRCAHIERRIYYDQHDDVVRRCLDLRSASSVESLFNEPPQSPRSLMKPDVKKYFVEALFKLIEPRECRTYTRMEHECANNNYYKTYHLYNAYCTSDSCDDFSIGTSKLCSKCTFKAIDDAISTIKIDD